MFGNIYRTALTDKRHKYKENPFEIINEWYQ